MVQTSVQEALERNTSELARLTGSLEARNTIDGKMAEMWCKTLNLSEKRDKRMTYLLWALVVANIFLATGHILKFTPWGA